MGHRRIPALLGAILLAAATSAWGQAAKTDTSVTPAKVALGDRLFHGQTGGAICFSCHGPDGKGVQGLAPDLTSGKWVNGDGSYAFIVQTITKGVPKPKQAAAPMPPMGGAQLTPAEINALAAYVYSLGHAKGR
jgi:mono/diheme cytochrome c family protein